tara:strand:+ start:399 stop:680 length:282 start_codon:yes stop_codon:yes gene_type:complete
MGYYDRTYHKVVGITGGMGFSGGKGPLPRAVMAAETNIVITFKDIHGTEVQIGGGDNANWARLYEGIEISDVVSIIDGTGTDISDGQKAFVLW